MSGPRGPWQGEPTSFDYEARLEPVGVEGKPVPATSYARVAGVSFEAVEKILPALGTPIVGDRERIVL